MHKVALFVFVFVLMNTPLSAQKSKIAFSLDRSIFDIYQCQSLSCIVPDSLEPQGDFQFEQFTVSIKRSANHGAVVLENKSDEFRGLCRNCLIGYRFERGGEIVFQDIYYRRPGDTQLRKYPSFVIRMN